MAAILAVVIACLSGASAYAFTASNTLPTPMSAGGATAAVSGYTVSTLAYFFSADGTTVTKITFDLDKAASDVQVALTASSTPVATDWVDCGASAATTPFGVTCTFTTPVPNGSADNLSVVAVSSGTATIG